MAYNYTVNTKILRPIADVFSAIASKDRLVQYFAHRSNSDLAAGQQVIWQWQEWGDYPVMVNKIITNELIELSLNSKAWQKTQSDSYDIQVIFKFESLSETETMLSISEQGWKTDEEGLVASHQNCAGWTHMAMCLKAYLEHKIDMR